MIHDAVPPEAWAAEGARIAGALEEVAAALVVGREADAVFTVAFAAARAQRDGRRVAIGDLIGHVSPLSPADGSPGLAECFRDGISVSDIARPLTDDGDIFALPSGAVAVRERWLFESGRWERLVEGFREVDALLLLIAPPDAPGLDALARAVDGVVAVDVPPSLARTWPLLATVDRPEPELPALGPPATSAAHTKGRPRTGRRRAATWAALMLVAAALGLAWWRGERRGPDDVTGIADPPAAAPVPGSTAEGVSDQPRASTPVTIALRPVVNPADAAIAADFAIELVAANTLSGANSRLAMRGVTLPAPTLAPVQLGSDGRPWFRALVGAWRERGEAQAELDALRARGLVRQDVGRVLRVPYALRLATGVHRDDAATALLQWRAQGIPAYALLQDDGRVSVFAGAFETSGQAVLLARSLIDLGIEPVVAFRTGRAF